MTKLSIYIKYLAICLLFACSQFARPSSQPLGLWVESQGKYPTFATQDNIKQMFDQAQNLGVKVIYLQVARAGRAWFDSSFADKSLIEENGFDPLGVSLQIAKQRNIQVYAWVNMFNLADNLDAPIVKRLGKQILLQDNFAQSLEQYKDGVSENPNFTIGAKEYWLNPASPQVHQYLIAMLSELLNKYPDLAGLHLDYIRYPYSLPIRPGSGLALGIDFGYNSENRQNFEAENKIENAFKYDQDKGYQPINYKTALLWDEWRRQSLNQYLIELKFILGANKKLSTAVMPWSDRAYLSAYQDWRYWMDANLADQVCLMNYSKDFKHFEQVAKQANAFATNNNLCVGIGAWLFSDWNEIQKQIDIAKKLNAFPVLFSYSNLKVSGLLDAGSSLKD